MLQVEGHDHGRAAVVGKLVGFENVARDIEVILGFDLLEPARHGLPVGGGHEGARVGGKLHQVGVAWQIDDGEPFDGVDRPATHFRDLLRIRTVIEFENRSFPHRDPRIQVELHRQHGLPGIGRQE
jgi:hypothetical protein